VPQSHGLGGDEQRGVPGREHRAELPQAGPAQLLPAPAGGERGDGRHEGLGHREGLRRGVLAPGLGGGDGAQQDAGAGGPVGAGQPAQVDLRPARVVGHGRELGRGHQDQGVPGHGGETAREHEHERGGVLRGEHAHVVELTVDGVAVEGRRRERQAGRRETLGGGHGAGAGNGLGRGGGGHVPHCSDPGGPRVRRVGTGTAAGPLAGPGLL
jgi:hypothetical protein